MTSSRKRVGEDGMNREYAVRGQRAGQTASVAAAIAKFMTVAALAMVIGGCGGGSTYSETSPSRNELIGVVQGGTAGEPIRGAEVTLYAAGSTGYGAGSIQLASTTSDKHGRFKFRTLGCMGGQQLYLVASGGTASGQSTPNSAIALSTVLGPCGLEVANATITEVTTIAAVWALNQFTDSTGQAIGAPASNLNGLNNAIGELLAPGLVDLYTGLAPDGFPEGISSSTDTLYALADILATCVDSSGANSGECQDLFTDATPPVGSAPTTTLEAAVDMARFPANNVDALYSLIPADPPFTPYAENAPLTWAMSIEYDPAGANMNNPYALALDAAGDVFVANAGGDSITELVAEDKYMVAYTFSPSQAAVSFPTSVAVDSDGNVWVANYHNDSVSELTADSFYDAGFNFSPTAAAIHGPLSLALDTSGNVWVANYISSTVSELTAASGYSAGSSFAPSGASFSAPASLVVDSANNIFAANFDGDSISELTASSGYATGFNFNSASAEFSEPISIAVDTAGNLWAVNDSNNSVSELTAASSYSTGFNFATFDAMFNVPLSVAVDSADNIWVANLNGNTISELTAASGYTTGINFAPSPDYQDQFALALDSAGNVWIVNNLGDSVTAMLGAASPVLTPIQSCLIQGQDVCLP
jgi:sugar lactone lactonase YvrE